MILLLLVFTDIRAQFTVRVERTVLNCLSVARVLSRDLAFFFFQRIKKSYTMQDNTREVIAGLTSQSTGSVKLKEVPPTQFKVYSLQFYRKCLFSLRGP